MKPAVRPPLDENVVAEFLANNADFFARRPELLPDPDLGAEDSVVPLAERQLAALRTRNGELRSRMADLLGAARDNDRSFARLRAFTLALMDAADAAQLDEALAEHLVAGFETEHATCFAPGRSAPAELAHLSGRAVEPPWDRLFDYAEPVCGAYRAQEYALLFPVARLAGPGSVAVVPLPGPGAALAIGSADPARFSPDMGKVFLAFLGEVLERTLRRLRLA